MLPPLERLNTGDSALFLKEKRTSPVCIYLNTLIYRFFYA